MCAISSFYKGRWIKYGLLLFLAFAGTVVKAQTFTARGGALYDYYGFFYRQEFAVEVKGLPKVTNSSFGLEGVMLNIHHKRVSDLKITLQSPDGTSIWLTNRNGQDGGDHSLNTLLAQF